MRAFVTTVVVFLAMGFVAIAGVEGLPEPAEPRPAKFLSPQEKTLANGLRVIVVERPGLPLVSAEVLIRSGSEADPEKSAGLAAFTADLLTQGTTTLSATQIAREVESLGATLEATAGWDGTSIELTTLAEQIEPAFALLADVTRNPKFATAEVERLRRQTLDDLRLSLEEPGTVAKLAASRAILGTGRYAYPREGTVLTIQQLRRQEMVDFHAARFTAGGTVLIIVGKITADTAFALAEKNFGEWKAAPDKPAPALPAFAPATKPRAILIDMPNAGQAAVVVGGPGVARDAENFFAGAVANTVLGGGYTSRLNQEIRLKRGLSYGARSTLTALRGGGLLIARCQTKNESASEVVELIRAELLRLGSEPVPADFLSTRQATLGGDFTRDLETNAGYVSQIAEFASQGIPLEQFPQYLDRIREVTPEAVLGFGEKHLVPTAMSVIVAGQAKDIAKPLRALFPGLEIISLSELDLGSPTLRRGKKR